MSTYAETREQVRAYNMELYENLSSSDPQMVKKGESAVQAYTRTKVREDGNLRRIMPPIPVTPADLQRSIAHDASVIVIDKEPDSPAAMTVPYGLLPQGLYLAADRYEALFARIRTPRYSKDVAELRTWTMDLRQVVSDNSIRDLLAEEDSGWFATVDAAVLSAGSTVPTSGVIQHQNISGGVSRDTLWDSFKVLPNTPSAIPIHTVVCNHITINDVAKMPREEHGDDMAGEIMRQGWTMKEFMGKTWIITIKKGLVPTNTMYHFGDPAFMGKFFVAEDTVLYVKREAYFIDFFAYEEIAVALGNTSAVARVNFTA